jgi:hypothetical protein
MKPLPRFCKNVWIKALRFALHCALITLLLATAVIAATITYTGFTITDGQLGSWHFHNARVFLTFVSDTMYVHTAVISNPQGDVSIEYNQTGIASITIVGDGKSVTATFDPNQIFISYDLTNGGVGFGSCLPTCSVPLPNSPNLQPAYPFGVSAGTVDGPNAIGLGFDSSPEELNLSSDLMHDTGLSGRGWVCLNFANPDFTCPAPTVPLKTNKGDLYLFQPYQGEPLATSKVLNGGLFFADLTDPQSGFPRSLYAPSIRASSGPITYNVFLVSDVSIGGQFYYGAKIHLSFSSNTFSVRPLSGAGPHAYVNEDGTARVVITKGSTTISAKFEPYQIYVFFDPSTSSVGFGSFSNSGGRAYPVTLTQNSFNSAQLVGAVSDIINSSGVDAVKYTPKTKTLVTNLANETVLADFISSCPAPNFDPATSFCLNMPTPTKLTTNKGDFYLYQPYTQFFSTPQPFSNNWGMYWSTFVPEEDD